MAYDNSYLVYRPSSSPRSLTWFPDGSVGILLLQQIKNRTRWVESGGVAEANCSCAAARIVEKVWNGIGGCICGNGQR